ncbi:hypothetical protein TraAM80_02922 [Trypanosoma rangeli]|uniref:Uncharacterized protein n=1 Tax=Trypanosoma rangeli TaxID=5698 RepID=A0A3R7L610_TRYRA|nr:uncharacterized protein TraAM80_02922 [Trypanosoma rangeli]RNF08332.1 hypothetical protein TraAM80_02922 [Trypanosoma rangeli]|eukprot:RNF08332.1 hypothetical protein TraAM80_02922 [Trypanosoma rangeli]
MENMECSTQYSCLPQGALLLPCLRTIPTFRSFLSPYLGAACVTCVTAEGSQAADVLCLLPLNPTSVTEMKDVIVPMDSSLLVYSAFSGANCGTDFGGDESHYDCPYFAYNNVFSRMVSVPMTPF